jgi:DNA helicase II / ATP-dependent DNA helicase PcrA
VSFQNLSYVHSTLFDPERSRHAIKGQGIAFLSKNLPPRQLPKRKLLLFIGYSAPMSQGELVFQDLNEAQRQAVLAIDGPLLIVAGAGAGKTKTITHRIAHLIETGIAPQHILALTFTNKAAGEMRDRVRSLIPKGRTVPLVSTFHALAVRLLREFGERVNVSKNFHIWDRDDQLRAMKRVFKARGVDKENPRPALALISKQKGLGKTRDVFSEGARDWREEETASLWTDYEKELREARALDFDDLLLKALELVREHADIRSLLQHRWTHLTVDEYQDTSALQFEFVRLLAGERVNLCVVGDVDQCIYSWRMAKIENLLSFERTFPGTTVVRLEDNYRSTGTIIAAANSVIEKNTNRLPKTLRHTREVGAPIELCEAHDDRDEAYLVAAAAEALIRDGTAPSNIAVLYRTQAQSRAFEDAFLHTGVPYSVIGTRFFERKEVKDALSYMRIGLSEEPLARECAADIARIIATPPRGIGETTLKKFFDAGGGTPGMNALGGALKNKMMSFGATLEKIQTSIRTLPASEAVRFVLEVSGIEGQYKGETDEESKERLQNIRELVNLAVRYDDHAPPIGIQLLLEEAALQSDQDEVQEEKSTVSLMTIHASKGLEFSTVFVTGLEQGLFPGTRLSNDSDPEEERRLFYVALTRAKDRLFLSFARERLRYGERQLSVPSEFIDDIDPRLLATPLAPSTDSGQPRSRGLLD